MGFAAVIGILLVANFLVSVDQDPYQTLFERLQPSFYTRTVLILLISSLLYTPISYGISQFILSGRSEEQRMSDLFFMFSRPILFLKAVTLRVMIWITRGLCQILVLFFGALAETILSFILLHNSGVSIWSLSLRQLPEKIMGIMARREYFAYSLFLWCIIILALCYYFVRFLFCKYALLRYNELSPCEAYGIGLCAFTRCGLRIVVFYLQKTAYYFLIIASFGLLRKRMGYFKKESFSAFATQYVECARHLYFREKALKPLDKY